MALLFFCTQLSLKIKQKKDLLIQASFSITSAEQSSDLFDEGLRKHIELTRKIHYLI